MSKSIIMDKMEMDEVTDNLADKILGRHPDPANLVLIGIQRRGADLSERLANRIEEKRHVKVVSGSLDINLYRDDWTIISDKSPYIGQSFIPFDLDGKTVILVDDVLFSGRTVRAALEALLDYGRPDAVELLVFIDRGHRELPISADYAGKQIKTSKHQRVDVLFRERDGQDRVCLSD